MPNDNDLSFPSDIIENNPEMKKAGWTKNAIGQLLQMNLIRGKVLKSKKGTLVYEADVKKIFSQRVLEETP